MFTKQQLLLTFHPILLLVLLPPSSHPYEIATTKDALDYLSHFGYLPTSSSSSSSSSSSITSALKEFQLHSNIVPNGRLNSRTIRSMNRARCGNRDLRLEEGDELSRRRKKRESRSTGWNKQELSYRVAKFSSSSLSPKILQKELDLAFKYWERVANITFKKAWKGKPDIEIKFVTGRHGDEEDFEGVGKTLAHAFYPSKSDIHFDDAEKWTANGRHGHNLRTVAVHEIGHSLGLGHSTERDSVMYLMYQGFKDKLKLHPQDISAIQTLYGPKSAEEEVRRGAALKKQGHRGVKKISEASELCSNGSIDAISTLADGMIYIFKGEHYYRMEFGKGLQLRGRINETFQGLPSNLDTVLTIPNGKTYFFKGNVYWRSTGDKMDGGYPKKIKSNFIGIPNNVEASFIWSWNNMAYFFKKNRYWRYNLGPPTANTHKNRGKPRHGHGLIEGYPKKISSNWPGIPDDVEDAFKAPNGRTYFFKGGQYWQFHDPNSIDEAARYPRAARRWWFSCNKKKKGNKNKASNNI